jgi:hypothetical protein
MLITVGPGRYVVTGKSVAIDQLTPAEVHILFFFFFLIHCFEVHDGGDWSDRSDRARLRRDDS